MNKVIDFFKDSYEELKRIQWPTRKEATRLTGFVVGVSLGVGLFVMAFDYAFTKLLTFIITK